LRPQLFVALNIRISGNYLIPNFSLHLY